LTSVESLLSKNKRFDVSRRLKHYSLLAAIRALLPTHLSVQLARVNCDLLIHKALISQGDVIFACHLIAEQISN